MAIGVFILAVGSRWWIRYGLCVAGGMVCYAGGNFLCWDFFVQALSFPMQNNRLRESKALRVRSSPVITSEFTCKFLLDLWIIYPSLKIKTWLIENFFKIAYGLSFHQLTV